MKKNKKLISIVLAIVLIISFTTTFWIATANAKKVSVEITTDKTEIVCGESATVSVKVTANCTLATMSIPVFYDKTLVDVSEATATLDNYAVESAIIDKESADPDRVYNNTGIDSEKFGFVLVNYIDSAGSELNESMESVVLTFKITAKADVRGSAVLKCVKESAKTNENIAGMLYFGSMPEGTTIDEVPENIENITLTGATASVRISNDKNTLTLKEDAPFEAYIDYDNNVGDEYAGTIYGFDTLGWNDEFIVDGKIADFYSTAYGDDYLEVVVGEAGVETTGTVVNVLDEEGIVVESYVYIYFGDIDMDGNVGESDAAIAADYELLYEGFETLYQFIAADLDADTMPGESDAGIMADWELLYEGMPLQSDIGAAVYGNIIYEIF